MKVIFFRKIDKGSLVASFNVQLPSGMIIYKCNYVKLQDGREFCALPQEKVSDNSGVTKYFPFVGFVSQELKETFSQQLMTALKDYLFQNPGVLSNVTRGHSGSNEFLEHKDELDW